MGSGHEAVLASMLIEKTLCLLRIGFECRSPRQKLMTGARYCQHAILQFFMRFALMDGGWDACHCRLCA
jgi:hypothetical protein